MVVELVVRTWRQRGKEKLVVGVAKFLHPIDSMAIGPAGAPRGHGHRIGRMTFVAIIDDAMATSPPF